MKVSINKLEEYSERNGIQKTSEPLLTIREFNLIAEAVRKRIKELMRQKEGETFKERHRRLVSKVELDSALNKLRTLTPQRYE